METDIKTAADKAAAAPAAAACGQDCAACPKRFSCPLAALLVKAKPD